MLENKNDTMSLQSSLHSLREELSHKQHGITQPQPQPQPCDQFEDVLYKDLRHRIMSNENLQDMSKPWRFEDYSLLHRLEKNVNEYPEKLIYAWLDEKTGKEPNICIFKI
eukprot:Pgem_evm1s7238